MKGKKIHRNKYRLHLYYGLIEWRGIHRRRKIITQEVSGLPELLCAELHLLVVISTGPLRVRQGVVNSMRHQSQIKWFLYLISKIIAFLNWSFNPFQLEYLDVFAHKGHSSIALCKEDQKWRVQDVPPCYCNAVNWKQDTFHVSRGKAESCGKSTIPLNRKSCFATVALKIFLPSLCLSFLIT